MKTETVLRLHWLKSGEKTRQKRQGINEGKPTCVKGKLKHFQKTWKGVAMERNQRQKL